MSDQKKTPETEETEQTPRENLPELPDFATLDGRVHQGPGEPDVHIPRSFWPKVVFVIFSLLLTALGVWMIWDPLVRFVAGETTEARVVRLVRTQPGVPDRIIRYRKPIEEEVYTVTYQHYVAVTNADGSESIMRLGVDSAKMPYASVNDKVKIVYFPGEEVAYGLHHFRTWAFGAGYLSVGLILSMLAINTLYMVGKPIVIDPESDESLLAEREELQKELERKKTPTKGRPQNIDDSGDGPTEATKLRHEDDRDIVSDDDEEKS